MNEWEEIEDRLRRLENYYFRSGLFCGFFLAIWLAAIWCWIFR